MRTIGIIILLAIGTPAFSGDSVTLLNGDGKQSRPIEMGADASWLGLAELREGSNSKYCAAVHVNYSGVTVHSACLPSTGKSAITIHYWNKSGKQSKIPVTAPTLNSPGSPIVLLKLPGDTGGDWISAGDVPRKDDSWFGGFHPDWELVRIYDFEEVTGTHSFKFQVNTCKSSSRSPLLQRVKPGTEEDDEETIQEVQVIPSTSEYKKHLVIEKCLRPIRPSAQGALITLAKSFTDKLGFLITVPFEGFPKRELAFKDGTVLKYVGADGLPGSLPGDPAKIELSLSFGFEKLFGN